MEAEPARRREVLLVLCAQVFLIMLGLGLATPILPLYARSFGVGAAAVGSLVTVFGLARMVSNVPAGHWAERFGRKGLLVAGPVLVSVGSLGFALAGSFAHLLAWRVVQGLGSAVLTTAAMVVLADISTPSDRGKVMAFYQGSLFLGVGAGPALGGWIAEAYGLRAPFFVFSGLTLLAAAWGAWRIPETLPSRAGRRWFRRGRGAAGDESARGIPEPALPVPPKVSLARLARDPNFLLISLFTLGLFVTRAGAQMTLLPLFAHDRLGLSEARIGLAFTLISGINFATLYGAGWLTDRFGRKAVIVPSGLLTAVSILLFPASDLVAWFFLDCVLLGLASGISGPAPAAYAADVAPPGAIGPAMGLYRTFSDVGLVIGPVGVGWIADTAGFGWSFATNAALLAAVTVAFAVFARESAPGLSPQNRRSVET
ncbi:MAG TPA: MFS transporter [Thermoanaerobaculia bacterium]|nr:MFS transporter [Thermoanaerobaculia bacterium]